MGYQIHRSGHHVVVRWTATPTVLAIEKLHADLDVGFKAAGVPLVCFIVIQTDNVDLPDTDARRVFQAKLPDLHDRSTSVDIVLMGDSLRASLIRTTLRAMSLVTRTGHRITIHNGPEEALKGRGVPATIATALRAV